MSWRGRGSQRGRGGFSQTAFRQNRKPWATKTEKEDKPAPPPPPLGALIERLRAEDLVAEAAWFEDAATITDLKTLTSYNWLNKKEPSIIIPGAPPRWTPPAHNRKLTEDSGDYFRDVNAAHFPEHPMEPAVLAGLKADPTLPRCVNIVACGSTLGNLLRFVRREDRTFRMLAETVGDTLFLVRRENSPTDLLRGVYGYGHTFPEAYTTWENDVRGSVSHQRLISYRFGRLNLLVRFEGDGYVPSEDGQPHGSPRIKGQENPTSIEDLLSDLTDVSPGARALSNHPSGHSTDTGARERADPSVTEISVKNSGLLVDQSAVFDLKTRSIRKKEVEDTISGELSRCWVSQIQKFVLAYHDRGVFRDVQVTSIREKVQQWEKDHHPQLSQFAALLHRLVDTVSIYDGRKMELYRETAGQLELREQLDGVPGTLSPGLQRLWEEVLAHEDDKESLAAHSNKNKPAADKAGSTIVGELSLDWQDGEADYTGCSDECGYCGFCTY